MTTQEMAEKLLARIELGYMSGSLCWADCEWARKFAARVVNGRRITRHDSERWIGIVRQARTVDFPPDPRPQTTTIQPPTAKAAGLVWLLAAESSGPLQFPPPEEGYDEQHRGPLVFSSASIARDYAADTDQQDYGPWPLSREDLAAGWGTVWTAERGAGGLWRHTASPT